MAVRAGRAGMRSKVRDPIRVYYDVAAIRRASGPIEGQTVSNDDVVLGGAVGRRRAKFAMRGVRRDNKRNDNARMLLPSP
jgi:hypothetical protein